MSSPALHSADNADTLASRLAQRIGAELDGAIAARGCASIAFSGGNTPLPLFRALRSTAVDWSKVWVTLVDERWVDPTSAASNEGLLRRELLDHIHTRQFIALKNRQDNAQAGAATIAAALDALQWPLDVVVLGMGNDGHTASWFPGTAQLERALSTPEKVVATEAPTEPIERITLTRHAVLHSRLIFLHINGRDKRALLDTALETNDPHRLPICAVLHQSQTPLEIYWSLS